MTDIELLAKRILQLETRQRRFKLVVMVVCMIVAAGGIINQVRGIPAQKTASERIQFEAGLPPVQPKGVGDEVRARHFILIDEKGKERASLVADAAGSVFLVLSDTNGKTRANLSVSNDGPSLVFYDPSGQYRTILGSTTMVGSHVNENGIVERAPASAIVLFDRAGKVLFRTP